PVPQGSPLPRVLPAQPPSVAPVTPARPVTPTPGANRPLRVSRVVVEGVTAYPAAEIQALTQGLIGAQVPLSRIEAARTEILRHYRADGYILSAVSANIDASGTLRFVVTEGRIASVKLAGDIGPAGTQVLRFLNRLTEKRPIDSVTLERYLLLAQDVPGVSLHAVLQPSTEEPGAINLIAEVSRRPVSGLALMDNRASPFTGPIEGLGVLDLNSFTEFGERTELSLYHAFPNTETFGQISTEAFVGASGLKLRVYGGYGPTVPSGVFAAQGYYGTTAVFGGLATYPVIRSRRQTLNVYGSFDGIDSKITTTTSGIRQLASFDSLRVARTGADYARSDLLLGGARTAVNLVSVRLSQGLPILGASENGATNAPRAGERTDFFKFNFELSRTQTLFYPLPNTSISVMGLLTGQLSPDILPPVEQFYLGGARFTRGYYSGQVSGDKALAATAELQLNTGFNMTRFGLSEDVSTQFYLFYDWGETWQNQPQGLDEHISSAGGGMRMQLTRYAELDFEGLARFNRFPTGDGANVSPLYGGAFYWRALVRY
ncbi:MAG TPA: ShlB/FhaC/HecB family hemolysin secretion/activation protein, partial [Dyella sp.]|nr:ShlB/FhaC/HecB family hemolysin secretion/activation protein [Dyella sp.]